MNYTCPECLRTDIARVMTNGEQQKIKLKTDGTYKIIGPKSKNKAEVLCFRCNKCLYYSDDPTDFIPLEFIAQYRKLFRDRQKVLLTRARAL
ncbi:MAG TPA: hypothetical protein VMV86_01265 [Methanosarcinales archaeon]|nr:hypothetical protein [Methanosarcinales archaeon]